MDDIAARWLVQAETAGVTLLVSYDGAPDCAAILDSARLMQVFDALIGHAMAHSNRGVIEATQVRPVETGFALTGRVRDNGATYAPHYLSGMFHGVGEGAPAGGMGMQLELMLAQRSIAAMSGTLKAKANPGAGATVAFEIETPAAEGTGARGAAVEELAPVRSAHILVVDDNATNRMVVEALCEMFDCSTKCGGRRRRGGRGRQGRPLRRDPDGHQDAADGRASPPPRRSASSRRRRVGCRSSR